MKIKYEFATETVEIEVEDKWAEVILELDRLEYNNNQTETRRHTGFGEFGDEAGWLSTEKPETFIRIAGQTFSPDDERFEIARESLSEKQDELYEAVYVNGDKLIDYARDNDIAKSTASRRNKVIIKKFKKAFE